MRILLNASIIQVLNTNILVMPTKRKPKPEPEPILNADPLMSRGVIVTHPEKHITPGNASIVWLIVMMAIIGGVGAICTTIWWQKEDLTAQIEAPYVQDNSRFLSRFLRGAREKMVAMKEQEIRTEAEKASSTAVSALVGNRDIYSKIEDWSSYKKAESGSWQDTFADCGEWIQSPEYSETMRQYDEVITELEATVYEFDLPGLSLAYTPLHEDFLRLRTEKDIAKCGWIAAFYPLHVYEDKILWGKLSCGGVYITEEENAQEYEEQQQCDKTTKVLRTFFGKP